MVPYYLDETRNWALDIVELKQQINKAKSMGTTVKAIVIINPGNPTG